MSFHFSHCEYFRRPFEVGESSVTGWCTKEETLRHCNGNPCPYLKYKQDELEVKRIMANVFAYYQTITWDELSYGVTVMGKGLKDIAEIVTEGF